MDQLHSDTWRLILIFFSFLGQTNKLAVKTAAQTFADILFKPSEFESNDMSMWRLYSELLRIMIDYNEDIFLEKQSFSKGGGSTPTTTKKIPQSIAPLTKKDDVSTTTTTKLGEPLIEIVDFDESEIENIQRDQWKKSQAKKLGRK